MAEAPTFNLLISNPERTFFDGPATSLTSKNDHGPFDILPNHAHFITLLNDADVQVVTADGQQKAYKVVRGLISCNDNKVRVFVDL